MNKPTTHTTARFVAFLLLVLSFAGVLHSLIQMFFRAEVKPERMEPEPVEPPEGMPSIEALIYIILFGLGSIVVLALLFGQ